MGLRPTRIEFIYNDSFLYYACPLNDLEEDSGQMSIAQILSWCCITKWICAPHHDQHVVPLNVDSNAEAWAWVDAPATISLRSHMICHFPFAPRSFRKLLKVKGNPPDLSNFEYYCVCALAAHFWVYLMYYSMKASCRSKNWADCIFQYHQNDINFCTLRFNWISD